jgi:hypothetical protein
VREVLEDLSRGKKGEVVEFMLLIGAIEPFRDRRNEATG